MKNKTATPRAHHVRRETAALLFAGGIGTMQGLRTRGSNDRRHYAKELKAYRYALQTYWAPPAIPADQTPEPK